MNTTGFYNFDVTTGSSIQTNALFDILDNLTSIGNKKRSYTDPALDSASNSGRTESNHNKDP